MDWRQLHWDNCRQSRSEVDVRRAEQALGVAFPSTYRDCVRECHGGTPSPNRFSFRDPDIGTMESSLAVLLSLDPDDPENLLDAHGRLAPILPQGAVPFADDGGGDFMCFDFSNPGEASVGYWHHGEAQLVPLAASFSEFLDLLY